LLHSVRWWFLVDCCEADWSCPLPSLKCFTKHRTLLGPLQESQ
jgi:hypothetical protein